MDVLAAAVGTLDLGFVDVRDVTAFGELFIAILAMKRVLRHGAFSEPT